MKQISIVGFGRFGKTLYDIMKKDFSVVLFDIDAKAFRGIQLAPRTRVAHSIMEVYESNAVFFAVPIAAFEHVLVQHMPYITDHLLVDVLSVKVHPERMLKNQLRGTGARYMLTHPMFGPDSVGGDRLPFVMYKGTATAKEYAQWKKYFAGKAFRIVELSPHAHDKFAAQSQGVTHFIGRMLEAFHFVRTPIDTVGASKLHDVKEQTCNDSWELFMQLQNYNLYTKNMRLALGSAFDDVYGKLLPARVQNGKTIIGIQGGVGSFNHEAVLDYIKRHNVQSAEIRYLYTTEKVMKYLHRGDTDLGLFAIHNSIGGVVDESIQAIARYKFKIVEEFAIPVRHHLMRRKDVRRENIKQIMAHPQALRQCAGTLRKRFPGLEQVSGKGDLVDTARAAASLAQGRLPKSTAVLGPKGLADMYGFEIIAEDMQDEKNNYTSFLLVKRP